MLTRISGIIGRSCKDCDFNSLQNGVDVGKKERSGKRRIRRVNNCHDSELEHGLSFGSFWSMNSITGLIVFCRD